MFLEGARGEDLGALIDCLRHAGVAVDIESRGIRVTRSGGAKLKAVDIETRPHPGFPTDLQAQFMALMTVAQGTSTIRENIFENRFMHAPELNRLGADITVRGNEAIVHGVQNLRGDFNRRCVVDGAAAERLAQRPAVDVRIGDVNVAFVPCQGERAEAARMA